jgi:hypothetical protein
MRSKDGFSEEELVAPVAVDQSQARLRQAERPESVDYGIRSGHLERVTSHPVDEVVPSAHSATSIPASEFICEVSLWPAAYQVV